MLKGLFEEILYRVGDNKLKSQRKSGFIISYIQILVSTLVGLLFTPFMISKLGGTEYGLYQLMYSTIGYLAVLDFGLGGTLTRFIIKYKSANDQKSEQSVISMCTKIYTCLALIIGLVCVGVSFNLQLLFPATVNESNSEKAALLVIIMGLSTAISFFSHAFQGIIAAYEQYAFTKGLRVLRDVLRIGILVVLLLKGSGSISIAIVDLLFSIIIAVSDTLFCKLRLKVSLIKGDWDGKLFKALMTFSIFVFIQILVAQFNTNVDRILLGRYATLATVGLYATAMQIYNLTNSFGGIVSGVSLPQISRVVFSGVDDKSVTHSCSVFARYQTILVIPLLVGFSLFGKQFINLWVGKTYDAFECWAVAMIMLFPLALECIESPIFHVMKAKNMQATRSAILLGVTLANFFLTIYLIKTIPIYGAAIGTSISFILGNNILANIFYHKKVKVRIPQFFCETFKGLLPAGIISAVIGYFIRYISGDGWFGLIIKCGLYACVFGILIIIIGFNKDEKLIIKRYINKGLSLIKK